MVSFAKSFPVTTFFVGSVVVSSSSEISLKSSFVDGFILFLDYIIQLWTYEGGIISGSLVVIIGWLLTQLPSPPPLLFSISGELARRASIYAVWFRFFEFDGGTNLSRVSFLWLFFVLL